MADATVDWSGRWNHLKCLLERPGPFSHPEFEPNSEVSSLTGEMLLIRVRKPI